MGEVTPPPHSPPSESEDSFNISNIPNLDGNESIISNEPNLSKFEKIPVHVSNFSGGHCQSNFKPKPKFII